MKCDDFQRRRIEKREHISFIKAFYQRTSAQIFIHEELTDAFEINTGVCQGCPFPYNIQINDRLDNGHNLNMLRI